jgi:hypothetical protein
LLERSSSGRNATRGPCSAQTRRKTRYGRIISDALIDSGACPRSVFVHEPAYFAGTGILSRNVFIIENLLLIGRWVQGSGARIRTHGSQTFRLIIQIRTGTLHGGCISIRYENQNRRLTPAVPSRSGARIRPRCAFMLPSKTKNDGNMLPPLREGMRGGREP